MSVESSTRVEEHIVPRQHIHKGFTPTSSSHSMVDERQVIHPLNNPNPDEGDLTIIKGQKDVIFPWPEISIEYSLYSTDKA
jgi:hypothetical protein